MKFFKDKKGFTLVELVVVIAILGILGGIAIPRFMDATASARGAKIVADLRTIDSAIMMYNSKVGTLPTTTAQLTTTTETATALNLLAAWPVPPTGVCKISQNAGGTKDYTPGDTVYAITDGRGTLDGKTVDALQTLP